MYDEYEYSDSERLDELSCCDDYNRFEEREVFNDMQYELTDETDEQDAHKYLMEVITENLEMKEELEIRDAFIKKLSDLMYGYYYTKAVRKERDEQDT